MSNNNDKNSNPNAAAFDDGFVRDNDNDKVGADFRPQSGGVPENGLCQPRDDDDFSSLACDHETGWFAVSAGVIMGLVALLFVWFLIRRVKAYPRGNDKMNHISDKIQSGARAFLTTQYQSVAMFVLIVYIALLVLYSMDHPTTNNDAKDGARYSSSFLFGALLSALAGWRSMAIATDANVRTTQAAQDQGLSGALRVAFAGGAVTGFTVVGLGLLGLSFMFWCMTLGYQHEDNTQVVLQEAAKSIAGFGFGASSVALFARVAGGIFTKAADVGADLVGKVELDIAEDDARNPAVIADNVGDNVGDVAGMGADLFESFVGSIIATLSLSDGSIQTIMLPFWIGGAGTLASMIGFFVVKAPREHYATATTSSSTSQVQLLRALNKGVWVTSIIAVILFAVVVKVIFEGYDTLGLQLFGCICIGLVAGIAIGKVTEYFTSYSYWPTQSIAQAGITGPATVVIQGLGVGMISTVCPTIILVVTILSCNALAGDYGIATASVGMLSTLGLTLATDAYGPIADNAGGIAEMANLEKRVRDTTDALDAMGNTTAATGKGFAIASAVLTALSLMAAFEQAAGIDNNSLMLDLGDPVVFSGVMIGAVLPFLFAALTMFSVQKAAAAMILEVRRQFAQIPGLMEGTAEPDSDRCVAIATRTSIQEMILPGMYAILSPLTVGFLVGPRCLAGLLGGSIASGMMLAIMMANAGGAWDNAKKYIENEGARGGKGTDTHKACIVGDTVGDPFKDTAGPSLNILIKLMSIVSLTFAPLMQGYDEDWKYWHYGLIPLCTLIFGTWVLYLLYWRHSFDLSIELVKKGEISVANTEDELEDVPTPHDNDGEFA
ncbi:hypothetical protein ACA910_015721 [Epithemia clementina (nom. ined.)]